MNCIEVQLMIMPFINNELDIKQLEEFVHHVNSCPSCMEELEVYYVLLAGMKQLDEDRELSNDFHEDLMNLLRESDERIVHAKFLHIRKRIVLIVLISLVAIFSSVRLGEFVVEEVVHKEVTKSNYLYENVYLLDHTFYSTNPALAHRNQTLDDKIKNQLSDIYVYLYMNDKEGAKSMKEIYGDQIWDNVQIPRGVGFQKRLPNKIFLDY